MSEKTTPLSFAGLETYSLFDRPSKVGLEHNAAPWEVGSSFAAFLQTLPKQLAAHDFVEFVDRCAGVVSQNKSFLVGIGAHVIKVGLSPLLIDLMDRGIISGLAVNGACVVHDTEMALAGKTSEDVDAVLGAGKFGMAKETGEIVNEVFNNRKSDVGFGEALGQYLLENNAPHANCSLFASARRCGIPITVHVAIGTDIVHVHPSANGAAIGAATYYDFQIFCRLVSALEGGVYVNIGSAVLLPEVFLKALTVVRNLGHTVSHFTT
ncbi:MAG: hypothetical protein P8130_07325, partial [Deltaproteobacteria bacterium]